MLYQRIIKHFKKRKNDSCHAVNYINCFKIAVTLKKRISFLFLAWSNNGKNSKPAKCLYLWTTLILWVVLLKKTELLMAVSTCHSSSTKWQTQNILKEVISCTGISWHLMHLADFLSGSKELLNTQTNHTETKREVFSLSLIIFAAVIIIGITKNRQKKPWGRNML